MLEQYSISDILTWLEDKTLVLNANFQRRSVWPPAARAYLIDTILRGRSMPKIYMRTKTDPRTRRSYREVVDGQQRLRAIRDFADGEFALGNQKEIYGEFAGKTWGQLDDETKQAFLSYPVGVEQLFNASDEEVLDTFHRLNAYGLDLNRQELRHGRFEGALRNSVVSASSRWSLLWEKYRIVGVRNRVRMADDELMAQMLGIILDGVIDGGQSKIDQLYRRYDGELPGDAPEKLDRALDYCVAHLAEILETSLSGAPHFLMLFAAVGHALFGIPPGDIKDEMPPRDPQALADVDAAKANLGVLADVLIQDIDQVPDRFKAFKYASAGTTQRIKSRKPRFLLLYRALLPHPI
jgi:hypothetical protein